MEGKLYNQELEKYIKSIKMLPSEEIRDLVIEYGKTKSKETLSKIIEQSMRLVYKIANKYVCNVGMFDISDLVQEGIDGVIKAAEHFDPDKDYMFSTYAYWWIEQRISRFTLKEKNYYSGSVGSLQKLQKLKRLKIEKELNGEDLTIDDVMKELNITRSTAKEYLYALKPIVYLNSRIRNSEENDTSELGEFIEDDETTDQYNMIMENDFREYVISILKKYLNDGEFEVILKRYGFYGEPMTLQQIGDDKGVSRERIRQIENKALKKLKNKREFKGEEFQQYKTYK